MNNENKQQSLAQQLKEHRRRQVTIGLDTGPSKFLVEEARQRGWRLYPLYHSGMKIAPWITCQGALLHTTPDSGLTRELRDAGCKVVRLGNLPHPQDNEIPVILSDMRAYGRRAAEHFHERAFQHVGFVAPDPWGAQQPLYEGFSERAGELGMMFHLMRYKQAAVRAIESPYDRYLYRQREFAEWLENVPKPLGLLPLGDSIAASLSFMISQAGFDVPGDVAVLALGEQQTTCECALPPLSSFADATPARVHAACEMLADWLEGGEPPREPVYIPPPPIIERQSTYVLAVNHPVVARALRFIWDHYTEPITVDDVAETVAVSRSKLKRLFRTYFPRGVKHELNRKRLEKCRQLLESSDLPMNEIARAAGFSSPAYMREACRNAFKHSPRDLRNRHRD